MDTVSINSTYLEVGDATRGPHHCEIRLRILDLEVECLRSISYRIPNTKFCYSNILHYIPIDPIDLLIS